MCGTTVPNFCGIHQNKYDCNDFVRLAVLNLQIDHIYVYSVYFMFWSILRILATHEAKNSKNRQLQDILFNNPVNTPSFKNLYDPFLTNVHRCKKCSDIYKIWWKS